MRADWFLWLESECVWEGIGVFKRKHLYTGISNQCRVGKCSHNRCLWKMNLCWVSYKFLHMTPKLILHKRQKSIHGANKNWNKLITDENKIKQKFGVSFLKVILQKGHHEWEWILIFSIQGSDDLSNSGYSFRYLGFEISSNIRIFRVRLKISFLIIYSVYSVLSV